MTTINYIQDGHINGEIQTFENWNIIDNLLRFENGLMLHPVNILTFQEVSFITLTPNEYRLVYESIQQC